MNLAFITQGPGELLSLYGQPEYDHGCNCPSRTSPECFEVYVYDATANGGTGELLCASCNPTGLPATADADFNLKVATVQTVLTSYLSHALADDGHFVFFSTAERLVAEDQNTTSDVYEFDTTTGEVHLISGGQPNSDSFFLDASADGHDVFFATRDQLVSIDTDQSADLYDARIGGVADTPVTPVAPCDGDGCRGPASSPPSFTDPESLAFNSLGNLKPVASTKKVSKSSSKSQKLKRALRACKSRHKRGQRKKCESAARRRFGKSGGSK